MLEEKPIPWKEMLETAYRRRLLILFGLIAGLLVAAAQAWLTSPVYRATARILLTDQALSGPREDAMPDKQIQAELAFLSSPNLIRAVLEDYEAEVGEPAQVATGSLARARAMVERLYSRVHDVPAATELDSKVQSIASRIRAAPIAKSNLVEVAFTGTDPEWAARFVNDLLTKHVERITELETQTGASVFFEAQRKEITKTWRQAQDELAAFRETHGNSLLAGDERQLERTVSDLEAQRVNADTQQRELEARAAFLLAELERHPATIEAESRVTENETVRLLRSKIVELEMQKFEKLARFRPESTVIRDLDRQIEDAKALLANRHEETLAETMTSVNPSYQAMQVDLVQTQSQLIAATARIEALSGQIAQYRDKLGRLERTGGQLERLRKDVESAREAYQTNLESEREANLSSALGEQGMVSLAVVDPAAVPLQPEPSSTSIRILVWTVIGLLGGLAMGFLKDWLDPSVKSSLQAARLSGVPVIAEIPAA